MKTTISGRPDDHNRMFPCLMNRICDKDIVFLVTRLDALYLVIHLTGNNIGYRHEVSANAITNTYEVFVGKLTLQND